MAGLLDMVNDPRQAFITQLGMGLLSAGGPSTKPVSFGQAFGAAMAPALQGAQQAQEYQMAQEEARRKKMAEMAKQQTIQQFVASLPPDQQMAALANPEEAIKAYYAMQQESRKASQPRFETVFTEKGGQQKAWVSPQGVMPVGGVSLPDWMNPEYQDFAMRKAQAGATRQSVMINEGQKGFENEMKLGEKFKGEPVYKAHQEMTSAYNQIKQSLKQNTPAGDLAGATKIMKLLDPGSVVRESELGMAMAATGLMDRVQNYADMIIRGTKLTPTQRKEFQQLADALYRESGNQYNIKRAEYQQFGSEYGLNAHRALGQEFNMPQAREMKPKQTQQVTGKFLGFE